MRRLISSPASISDANVVCASVGSSVCDEPLDVALRDGAEEPVDDLAVAQGVHRRDRLDPELRRDLRVLVDVDLGEHDLALGGVDHLLDDRSERAARAAPRRPQVDDDGDGGGLVDDVRLERRVGDVDGHADQGRGIDAERTPAVSPRLVATLRTVTSGGEAT